MNEGNETRDLMVMPVMSIENAVYRYNEMVAFVKQIMKDGKDFGVIPGTGSKPSLYKAGAEKLNLFFGLVPTFVDLEVVQDWTGAEHGGEPFFLYRKRCILWRNGEKRAEGDGSCNSWESKYRYRNALRLCPKCGAPAILKRKDGSGWQCIGADKGGCWAKFLPEDPAIIGQQAGRVPNVDIADIANTLEKMAAKRSLIAATLIGTAASEFYTQDIEDLPESVRGNGTVINGTARVIDDTPEAPKAPPKQAPPKDDLDKFIPGYPDEDSVPLSELNRPDTLAERREATAEVVADWISAIEGSDNLQELVMNSNGALKTEGLTLVQRQDITKATSKRKAALDRPKR